MLSKTFTASQVRDILTKHLHSIGMTPVKCVDDNIGLLGTNTISFEVTLDDSNSTYKEDNHETFRV